MGHFMRPQAYQDTWYEYEINGETFVTEYEEDIPEDAERGEVYTDAFFGRLSAPGYLDCTDWQGPYYTEDGALWELYEIYGEENETFFSFLEEGKLIEKGSLEIRGSRNELYGRAVGEGLVHLATMGDLDDGDDDTAEESSDRLTFGGAIYNPNDDPDLQEAYDFEIVDNDPITKRFKLTESRQRVLNAKRDSEFYVLVYVFRLWSDKTWSECAVLLPYEWSEDKRKRNAVQQVTTEVERGEARLNFNIPDLVYVGVRKEDSREHEYKDAPTGEDDQNASLT